MRTRFPPSPTGFLHVGGLRTALFSWLVARQTKGTFLVRIEDTDQERSIPGAVENILSTLAWAGLSPDEGVMLRGENIVEEGNRGPYIQSKRLDLYRRYAEELVSNGHAYYCFCTPERLEQMRGLQQAQKKPPMYDRHCFSLPEAQIEQRLRDGMPHVIRMKIPRERTITFDDDIRGSVSFRGDTVDDQVLLKSDGFPTYHLAHVVDDHLMDIDLVIRGEEWLSSLPKHLLLFAAFGWQAPRYAHVPLLLNPDKSKLSKRQGDVSVESYREKGYLPEAMLNFLVLLGWNPGTSRASRSGAGQARTKEQEIFSIDELIEEFSLERVQKSGAIFDHQKLDWIQGQWMRKLPLSELAERIRPLVEKRFPAAAEDKAFEEKVALIQERINFFTEAPDMLSYFYVEPHATKELIANPKQKVTENDIPAILEFLTSALETIAASMWSRDAVMRAIEDRLGSSGFKKGQVLWPLRAILTGREYSPGAYEVAAALGKEETMKRLEKAKKL